MKKRLHVSWFVAAVSAGLLVGVSLASFPEARVFATRATLVAVAPFLLISFAKRLKWMLFIALLGGTLIGLWHGANEQIRLSQYERYYSSDVTLAGRVAGDPTFESTSDVRMNIEDVSVDGYKLPGKVWLGLRSDRDIKRGDLVVVSGMLSEGFGTFSGAMYRAELAELKRPVPGDVGRQVRDWFAAHVRQAVPEPQASLGVSYVAGYHQALPEGLDNELRLLGLVHLVVASGFHLTLVVRFIRRPLSGVSKYLAAAGSLAAIGGFLLVSGFSTSMIRASLVTSLSLLAWYYGRVVHPVVLLLFVAALTVGIEPGFIWGDIGWYLSFAAFGGVIILAPLINRYFWGDEEPGFFRELLITTIAAQIVTFPVIAYAFGQYSPLALFSNVLIQPLVSIAMLFTLLAGVFTAILPGVATFAGWPAFAVLSYMTEVTDRLSRVHWAEGEVAISVVTLVSCYLVLVVGVLFLWRQTRYVFRQNKAVE